MEWDNHFHDLYASTMMIDFPEKGFKGSFLLLGLLVNLDHLLVWILVLPFSLIQGNKEWAYVRMLATCAQLGVSVRVWRELAGSHRIYRGKLDVMRVHSEMASQFSLSSVIPSCKWTCSWRAMTFVGLDHWDAPMCKKSAHLAWWLGREIVALD